MVSGSQPREAFVRPVEAGTREPIGCDTFPEDRILYRAQPECGEVLQILRPAIVSRAVDLILESLAHAIDGALHATPDLGLGSRASHSVGLTSTGATPRHSGRFRARAKRVDLDFDADKAIQAEGARSTPKVIVTHHVPRRRQIAGSDARAVAEHAQQQVQSVGASSGSGRRHAEELCRLLSHAPLAFPTYPNGEQRMEGSEEAWSGNGVIEWAPFRLREGVTEGELLEASGAIQRGFLGLQPGFLRRELAKRAEGLWVDVVHWADQISAQEAMAAGASSATCHRYFALMARENGGADPVEGVQHLQRVRVY